jgi:4-hydroxybenzoate polyprenyltransferase
MNGRETHQSDMDNNSEPKTQSNVGNKEYVFKTMDKSWYAFVPTWISFILIALVGSNLFAVFISHNGDSINWSALVPLLILGFWIGGIAAIDDHSAYKDDCHICTTSKSKYLFYQASKFFFGLITISTTLVVGLLALTSFSDYTQSLTDSKIIILLLASILAVFLYRQIYGKK